MPDFNELYNRYQNQIEDFWSRRDNAPRHEKTIHVFGHPVVFDSNDEKVLESAKFAEGMYSTSDRISDSIWRIHLTVRADRGAASPTGRVVDQIRYEGSASWLSIDLGEWGHCIADMQRGEAFAILSSALAENPQQVCLVLINTILTNFISRHGFSMLHASALIKDGNVLLLQAPHGTGKSTTALRLLLHGYQLLSDSMVYIGERDGNLWLGGFPSGRIKLRGDMLPLFPKFAAIAEPEPVREETKYRVDLKRAGDEMSYAAMIRIKRVEYCLLQRWDKPESRIDSLSADDLWPDIMLNSLHYDTSELWKENLTRIEKLVRRATLHRLRIGTDENEIVHTVNSLW